MSSDIVLAFALVLLVTVPGFLLRVSFRGCLEGTSRAVAESWALGLAVFSLLALGVDRLGLGMGWLPALALVVGLLCVGIRRPRCVRRPVRAELVSLAIVATFAFLQSWVADGGIGIHRDDAAHIGAIAASVRADDPFPADVFHAPGEVPGPDPRFGSVHALYAVVASVTGAPAAAVWEAARWVASPFLWLSFFFLARVVLDERKLAVLASVLGMALIGGFRFPVASVANYPLWIGVGMVWVVLAQWLEGRRAAEPVSLVVGCAVVFVHFFPWLLLSGLGLLWWAIAAWRGTSRWRPSLGGLALVAVLGGSLALRMALSYESVNPIHAEPWNVVSVGSHLQMYRPLMVLGVLGVFGVLAILVWWIQRADAPRENLAVWTFVGATLLIPIVISANPLAITFLRPYVGFLSFRLVLASLFPLVLVWGWERGTRRIFSSGGMRAALGAVIIFLLWAGSARNTAVANYGVEYTAEIQDALGRIARELPSDAVVLSDPYTMLGLNAFGGTAVVAVPDGRSSPRDRWARRRLVDTAIAMDPAAHCVDAIASEARLEATHLVVPRFWPRALSGYLVRTTVSELESAGRAWEERGARPMLDLGPNGALILDLARVACPSATPPAPVEPCGEFLFESRGGRLCDLRVNRSEVTAGDTLEIESRWWAVSDSFAAGWPRIYARLDRVPLTGGEAVGGKVKRKLLEKRSGERERARFDIDVSPAELARARRTGGALRIDFDWRLPPDLRPGKYRLELTWMVEGRTHTERLSDLWNNRDSYSGTPVANVEVLR